MCKMLCLLCFLAPGVLAPRSTNRQGPFQRALAQTHMLLLAMIIGDTLEPGARVVSDSGTDAKPRNTELQ